MGWFGKKNLEGMTGLGKDLPTHRGNLTGRGLSNIICCPLACTKVGLRGKSGSDRLYYPPTSIGKGVGCVMLAHSTHQKVRGSDMRADSVRDIWVDPCRTAAPACLHKS